VAEPVKKYYTNFLPKQKLLIGLKRSADDLIKFYGEELIADDLMPVGVADGYHFINFIASKCGWQEINRKLFVQCFVNAENSQQCSGFLAVYLLALRIAGRDLCAISKVSKSSFWINSSAAVESLEKFQHTQMVHLFKTIIDEIGISGKLKINQTDSMLPALELYGGHKFNVGLQNSYISNSTKVSEAKIILFDGAIKEIGQINHLFTSLSETKENCVIIARMFGDDVISTINVNKKRGTLNVFPIQVNDSIENINLLNDISYCTGATPITAESGRRLSQVALSDLASITGVFINKRSFAFDSKPERENLIKKKIDVINNKMKVAFYEENMTLEDIDKAYQGRLDSLCGNFARLWVPGNKLMLEFVRRNFKFSIEYTMAFANTGAVKTSDILQDQNLPALLPANIVETSLNTSNLLYSSITKAGGCVAIQ
tara:strand:- start:1163 stop:2452 length:1290 start_codon:yes stop_codon:yes gene_type:complete